MVDRRDFARGASEHLGLPRIKVTVEMYDSNRSIGTVHAAKQRQCDGVIATHGYHTREGLALLCKSRLISVGSRVTHEDAVVSFLDLMDGPLRIVGGDRNIAAI